LIAEEYPYDSTVDESRQRSLEKALAIFENQRKEHECEASKRIKRPSVSVKKGLLVIIAVSVTLFLLFHYVLSIYIESLGTRMLIVLAAGVLIFFVNMQKAATWLILVYQKLAPDELRLACVFEPSCSEYMLMAIKKHGPYVGVLKGIKRLLRCHYPNGGVDNP
jgi:putative membrane protein insertion efficiency factor